MRTLTDIIPPVNSKLTVVGARTMRKLSLAIAAVAAFTIGAPAFADPAPIILSEDFESGGFGIFTASGQVGVATGADYHDCCNTTGNTTNHFAAFGSGQQPSGLISTSLNLIAGETYTLSFDLGALGDGTDPISGSVGGLTFSASVLSNNNLDTAFTPFSHSRTPSWWAARPRCNSTVTAFRMSTPFSTTSSSPA